MTVPFAFVGNIGRDNYNLQDPWSTLMPYTLSSQRPILFGLNCKEERYNYKKIQYKRSEINSICNSSQLREPNDNYRWK